MECRADSIVRHPELIEKWVDDYRCFDTLHAVRPTRLPREKFYRDFADLYRQRNIGPYYELVQASKMTIEDCRRGGSMLDTLATWERYAENDAVLGRKSRHRIDPPPSPRLETSYTTEAGRNLRSPAPR